MSFASLLIHRCVIQRAAEGVADDMGHATLTWANHLSGVHCRYHPKVVSSSREHATIQKTDVLAHHQMFVHDIDVKEADRITTITEGATTLTTGPLNVIKVNRRADSLGGHHLELWLKEVGISSYA